MARKTTSAIPSYSVATVRACLNNIRSSWGRRNEVLFSPCSVVCQGKQETLAMFCQLFVIGCHMKRHMKGRKKK